MKRIFAILLTAASFTACNNNSTTTSTTDTTMADTGTVVAPSVTTDTVTTTTITYAPADGDVVYRDNKLYVMKNGNWVATDKVVTLNNGTVIYRDGTAKRDGKMVKLEDGEVVNKTGNFFDKSGHAIANAWGATKDAVSNAGTAVGKTAKHVGKKIDSVVTGKHRN